MGTKQRWQFFGALSVQEGRGDRMKSVMGFVDAPSVIRSQVEALQGWCCLARSIANSGKCLTRPSPWAAHTAPFSQAHHPEAAAATTAAATGSAERAPGQPWRDRQTGGQTDQAHRCGAAATSTTRAALASLPRPGRFPEPPPQRRRWEEGGGGGREGKRPPLPVWPLLSRPPSAKSGDRFSQDWYTQVAFCSRDTFVGRHLPSCS